MKLIQPISQPLAVGKKQAGATLTEYTMVLVGTVGVWQGLFGDVGVLQQLKIFYSYFMAMLALPL